MYKKIKETAEWLQKRMPNAPKTAIVLGTGLGQLAERIEKLLCIPYSEIPNFPVSTVEGHAGQLIFGRLGGVDVMAMEATCGGSALPGSATLGAAHGLRPPSVPNALVL